MDEEYKEMLLKNLEQYTNGYLEDTQIDIWLEATRQADERNSI